MRRSWACALVSTTLVSGALALTGFTSAPVRARVVDVLAESAARVEWDVTYCVMDGVELKMDAYLQEQSRGPVPAVVHIHGGGWRQGDKAQGSGLREVVPLLEAGFAVFSVNYRLAPRFAFPAMIEDVKCAIRSLRAHADRYGIDPGRIGVWGTSAGGHLAALLGVADTEAGFDVGPFLDQSSRVQAVVDLFGPADLTAPLPAYDLVERVVLQGFDRLLASPVAYVTPDDPPFLIIHGDADRLVPLDQSERLANKLIEAGVEAELVVVEDGPHGLIAPGQSPPREELSRRIVAFFETHLK